jgi:hypothetical protein
VLIKNLSEDLTKKFWKENSKLIEELSKKLRSEIMKGGQRTATGERLGRKTGENGDVGESCGD